MTSTKAFVLFFTRCAKKYFLLCWLWCVTLHNNVESVLQVQRSRKPKIQMWCKRFREFHLCVLNTFPSLLNFAIADERSSPALYHHVWWNAHIENKWHAVRYRWAAL